MPVDDVSDVVVIGAGPVGLALAIELGMRGVSVTVVERNTRSGTAPRAKTTNVRTRTHLRRWGIADRLAAESPFGVDYPNDMLFVTRLSGYRLAHFADAFNAAPERSDAYPEHAQWIPQYTLEKVLFAHARSLPSLTFRFATTFVSVTQGEDQVRVKLANEDGTEAVVTARYLVGADGARSAVRAAIGAQMEGRSGLSYHYNIIFRAPGLAAAHEQPPAVVYWQAGKDGFSALGPMDKDDVWFFGTGGAAEVPELSPDEAAELIRKRTGIDMPYEILSADSWVSNALLADRYSDGRILLAGDACHLHPPFGGYGMNMGIGDGVDLGWKIAATLQGWGGAALVASYEAERRPVHRAVLDEAVANLAVAAGAFPPIIEDDTPEGVAVRQKVGGMIQATKGREFNTLGTVLGLCYVDSPIIARESGPATAGQSGETYYPSARPGCLAPHAWLADGRSLYDLFGDGFALIVAANVDAGIVSCAEAEARSLGVPITIVRPDDLDVRALYHASLTLVRPDQHVAWRGERWDGALALATGAQASSVG
jgi:2-polyprenyl-6-methoxyphenol hydroxylase-like FAD-dependent oxidoreductase